MGRIDKELRLQQIQINLLVDIRDLLSQLVLENGWGSYDAKKATHTETRLHGNGIRANVEEILKPPSITKQGK